MRFRRIETYNPAGECIDEQEIAWTVADYRQALAFLDSRVSREKEALLAAGLIELPPELHTVIAEKVALREEMAVL